ncbi:MAG: zinc ribbon domain-containing protein [Ruminococcaceae bacterium]|nr:zinc ribbon domain-containing protein [Oscillospiraceae bacterium]
MSLSEEPAIKIKYDTAQNISDEILGGTIKFCRETGYKQNITMLTLFWTAFLVSAQNELNEQNLTNDVIDCYSRSLRIIFPKVSNDTETLQEVEGMQRNYWRQLCADFQTFKTETEISTFLQIANKLNSQDNISDTNPLITDTLKTFKQVSNVIKSSVYRILRQIDNVYEIEYKGVLSEFRYAKMSREMTVNPQNNTPKVLVDAPPKETFTTFEKPLGMAWYKFLVNFSLIAGAIINIIFGLNYISGGIYLVQTNGEVSAKEVYAYYGTGVKNVDVLYGFLLIAIAILAFTLRYKLANYKPDALKFVQIFYWSSALVPFLYEGVIGIIAEQTISKTSIISLFIGLILLFINIIYFDKRSHLFVDKEISEVKPVQTSSLNSINNANSSTEYMTINTATQSQMSLFCRKCGMKLANDSIFCHKCGTKVIIDTSKVENL